MSQVTVNFSSKVFISVYPCQEVYLCLTDAWEALTVDGTAFVLATIENTGRALDSHGVPYYAPDPRGREMFQYSLTYDDAQITDPVTNVIGCDDVVEVFPYPCTLSKLLALIAP